MESLFHHCQKCGAAFEKNVHSKRYCSEGCRKLDEARRRRRRNPKNSGPAKHRVRTSVCVSCSVEFQAGLRGPVARMCQACRGDFSPTAVRVITNRSTAPIGVLYAIQSVYGGPIKIGVAKDMKQRLSSLQCGNPEPLRVLKTWDTPEVELRVHDALCSMRATGEWFRASLEEIDRVVDAILAIDSVVKKVA